MLTQQLIPYGLRLLPLHLVVLLHCLRVTPANLRDPAAVVYRVESETAYIEQAASLETPAKPAFWNWPRSMGSYLTREVLELFSTFQIFPQDTHVKASQ